MDRNILSLLRPRIEKIVALHRSAWIEIRKLLKTLLMEAVALHRSAWIEIRPYWNPTGDWEESHSTGVRG